jgi:hypothetical protein
MNIGYWLMDWPFLSSEKMMNFKMLTCVFQVVFDGQTHAAGEPILMADDHPDYDSLKTLKAVVGNGKIDLNQLKPFQFNTVGKYIADSLFKRDLENTEMYTAIGIITTDALADWFKCNVTAKQRDLLWQCATEHMTADALALIKSSLAAKRANDDKAAEAEVKAKAEPEPVKAPKNATKTKAAAETAQADQGAQ